ncbi:hypothetical protein L4D20_09975 [Vibrio kyushuensis]|uniref:hypothetical protein n=1 Tax=Vibrio kyushuensis TaxID=2910249 RepID=UPI003D135B69
MRNVRKFTIEKIARTWIHATIKNEVRSATSSNKSYPARLVKTDLLSESLIGEEVYLYVEDVSVRSDFGTDLMYMVIGVIDDIDEYNRLASFMLDYAMSDAKSGKLSTPAMTTIVASCSKYPWLRLDEVELVSKFYISKPEFNTLTNIDKLLSIELWSFSEMVKCRGYVEQLSKLSDSRVLPNQRIDETISIARDRIGQCKGANCYRKDDHDRGIKLSLIC